MNDLTVDEREDTVLIITLFMLIAQLSNKDIKENSFDTQLGIIFMPHAAAKASLNSLLLFCFVFSKDIMPTVYMLIKVVIHM